MLKEKGLLLLSVLWGSPLPAASIDPADLDYQLQMETEDFIFFPVRNLSSPDYKEGVVWYRKFVTRIESTGPSEMVGTLLDVHVRVLPLAQENRSYERFFSDPHLRDHGITSFGFWNPHPQQEVCEVTEELKHLLSPLPGNPVIQAGGLPEACDITLTVPPFQEQRVRELVANGRGISLDMAFSGCEKTSRRVLYRALLKELETAGVLRDGSGDFYEIVWELHELSRKKPALFSGLAKEVIRALMIRIWEANQGQLPDVRIGEDIRGDHFQSCVEKNYQPGSDKKEPQDA